jgi:hypothetical protein
MDEIVLRLKVLDDDPAGRLEGAPRGATADQPTGSPSERRPPSTTNTRETLDSRARTRALVPSLLAAIDPPSDLRRRLELTWGAVNWFVGSSAIAFLANVFGIPIHRRLGGPTPN